MDNIFIERLWRYLKYESVYLHAWSGGSETKTGIGKWIEFYNTQRPHSAHNGLTPDQSIGQKDNKRKPIRWQIL